MDAMGVVKPVPDEDWDRLVLSHSDGWFWHTSAWRRYCVAKRGGTDLSFVMFVGGEPLVVVPLIAEGNAFLFDGSPTPSSLDMRLARGGKPERLPFQEHVSAHVNALAIELGVKIGEFRREPTTDASQIVSGDRYFHIEGMSWKSRVVCLSGTVEEMWRGVRKSYRSLIRKHEDLVVTDGQLELFDEYAATHALRYGNPRPKETYDLQREWVKSGNGIVVGMASTTKRGARCDGFAYWIVYKNRAYYASGVYEVPNVAHACIWQSLIHLKEIGVEFAELGWQGHARNEKEASIEFFKTGFGGEDWHLPVVRKHYLTHHGCQVPEHNTTH